MILFWAAKWTSHEYNEILNQPFYEFFPPSCSLCIIVVEFYFFHLSFDCLFHILSLLCNSWYNVALTKLSTLSSHIKGSSDLIIREEREQLLWNAFHLAPNLTIHTKKSHLNLIILTLKWWSFTAAMIA
jgi:hypothetical protein